MRYKIGDIGLCSIYDLNSPEYNMDNVLCRIISVHVGSNYPYRIQLLTSHRVSGNSTLDIKEREFTFRNIINLKKHYKNVK